MVGSLLWQKQGPLSPWQKQEPLQLCRHHTGPQPGLNIICSTLKQRQLVVGGRL